MPIHFARVLLQLAAVLLLLPRAALAVPDATTLLGDLGFDPGEIAKVQGGELVNGSSIRSSSPRELVAQFAFRVDAPPAKLVAELRSGLLAKVDPTVKAFGAIHGAGSVADFAKLSIAPKIAAQYASGSSDLNLSADEIAGFRSLAAGGDVAQQVRRDLLDRVTAYRAKGLAGIAPYVRDGGTRSPADELRSATLAAKPLAKYAPAAYQLLLDYPANEPAGFEETFGWTQFDAHGTPTIALTHGLFIPDGDAYVAVQRQFYVSTGYNCEQAIAAFVPTASGTIVAYANRTSTDQITGLGGSAKRSIGSKVLASQLGEIFQKFRSAAGGKP